MATATMATRTVSPGGALLRASRIFAIPPKLSKPADQLSSQAIFSSETATLIHPIRQTITTPPASLARGDWGMKRPLPLRSTTKSSTPLIRVEAIDTFEHITEYGSSADHTINLYKWQEMGVPMTVPVVDEFQRVRSYQAGRRKSVFEDEMDYTTPRRSAVGGQNDLGWKYKGPYLAGQSEGDFMDYLSTEVRKRKPEFLQFLRKHCAHELNVKAQLALTEEDEVPDAILEKDVTQDQFTSYLKVLRKDRITRNALIRDFFDLAPVTPARTQGIMDDLQRGFGLSDEPITIAGEIPPTTSPYGVSGPPKTHPSAGLSYARSQAYTPNHPQFGPQKHKRPVQGRVIRPRGAQGGSFNPTLGVGGFVVDAPGGSDAFTIGASRKGSAAVLTMIPGIQQIEPEKVGGSKTYLQLEHAQVNAKGQVTLTVDYGDPEAVAVLENTTDQIPKPPTPAPKFSFKGAGRVAGNSLGSSAYGLSDDAIPSLFSSSPSGGGGDAMATLKNLMG